MKRPHLLHHWERFVNRRDWKPAKNSVLCEKHFTTKYIKISENQRTHLDWQLDPVPTIQTEDAVKFPSILPTPVSTRRPPTYYTKRVFQVDEMPKYPSVLFYQRHVLHESHPLLGYFQS